MDPLYASKLSERGKKSKQKHKNKNVLFTTILDLPIGKEKKQNCTHADHNKFDDPLPFTPIIPYWST